MQKNVSIPLEYPTALDGIVSFSKVINQEERWIETWRTRQSSWPHVFKAHTINAQFLEAAKYLMIWHI